MKWLIGIAAGAAVIYLLKTEKGKELMDTVKQQACDLTDNLTSLFNSGADAAKSAAKNAGVV